MSCYAYTFLKGRCSTTHSWHDSNLAQQTGQVGRQTLAILVHAASDSPSWAGHRASWISSTSHLAGADLNSPVALAWALHIALPEGDIQSAPYQHWGYIAASVLVRNGLPILESMNRASKKLPLSSFLYLCHHWCPLS